MKESEKMQLNEWAARNGLAIKDYEKANSYRSDTKVLVAWIGFIGIVACIALILQSNRVDAAYSHCAELLGNAPYQQVHDACTKMVSSVLS